MLSARRVVNAALHAAWRRLQQVGDISPGTRAADRFGSFGAGSCLGFPLDTLYGESAIHIGADTLIGRQCTLAVGYGPTQQVLPPRGLVIGDRCVIGARACITAHDSIVIGDDVTVTVLEVRGDQVRLGIEAPRDVKVFREEVLQRDPPPATD